MIKRFTERKCAADTRESRKRPGNGAGSIKNILEDQGHPVGGEGGGGCGKPPKHFIKGAQKTIYRRKPFVALINVVQK